MNFGKIDLEEYNDYMNFIRECIKEESLIKFKLKVVDEQIKIEHIKPYGDKWKFYYCIKNNYKAQFEEWKGSNKRSGMGMFVSFEEWKLLLIKENRDSRINELLSGLDTTEKNKLGI